MSGAARRCPTVTKVLALLGSRQPRLAAGHLVAIDGPSGSGKTTLAAALAAAGDGVVLHTDDLLAGWDGGLDRMARALEADVLAPLSRGEPAAYRPWDWHRGRFTDPVPLPPTPLLVVEGVGAGSRAVAPYLSALVWVDADPEVRKERGLARDGDTFAPHWDAWAAGERRHFAADRTSTRADVVIRT